MNGGFKESDMKTLVKLVTDNGTVTKFKEMRLAAEKAAAEKSFAEKAAAELKKQKENGIVVTPSPIPQFDTNKDPFDPAYCQGEPLSLENAKKAFAGGALVADIGSYKIYRRERTCNSISGCGPW